MSELKIKTVEDSKTEVSHLLFSKHMNSAGRLFGGQLLMWIDEVAALLQEDIVKAILQLHVLIIFNLKNPAMKMT